MVEISVEMAISSINHLVITIAIQACLGGIDIAGPNAGHLDRWDIFLLTILI
jgi:hypothetical protein